MKKILLISSLLTLFTGYSFAQCDENEVEVRVEIMTDDWGYETSWTLSDLLGTIVMQGGQNGVYQNNTSYSDSICVLSNECLFFEIYDTWGDGIYAPGGCKVYLDEMLVYSASNDIGSYAMTVVNCWDSCGMILTALNDLQAHINGAITLDAEELTLIRNVFTLFPECLAGSESNILLSKSVVEDYDNEIGALFTTPTTENGFPKDPAAAPGMELERAMFALQQGIFDCVFTPEIYADYPQHINGWKFNSCSVFPGFVDPPADSSASNSALILANFEDPDGMNPYFDINGDGTDHALRPTGLYLSPGSIASVTVPDSLVGQGYYIRVGSHEWDLTDRTYFRRFDRISRKFPITSTTTEVFNPFGGAISVLVPYGANDGIVGISVSNGVEAPFFSLKSFYETPDFNAEFSKPGPWAVFETENVMFTIPKHSIAPFQYDLMQAMLDWESAVRGVNSILARQIIPDKHNMYMIADIDIRTGSYSIGYPMSNTPLNYTNVPGPAYFINGPGPDDETNFHETGHALAISKFPGEEEALVNVPYIMAMNYGLDVDLNVAVNYSFVPNTFDIDKTATHRIVSNTFGSERDISNTTTDEVRYQHRGYGHYFEIVNMFGWCPLRNFWKQEFMDFENGIIHGGNDQEIDSRIIRMSVAAQADLRPLFHVFGILPQDSIAVQDTLAQIGVPQSLTVYNRLQDYFDLIPEDNAAFVNYALSVYPDLYTNGPIEDPDYGVGWHYQKSLTYDAAEAQIRTDILQSIIELYYPDGEPAGNGNPDVCCLLDTMNIYMVNEVIIVTGGVPPYDISIDTTGNVMTVAVVDFDGCESTAQFILTSLTDEEAEGLRIYPNPASTEIYIDFTGGNKQIESLRIVSIHGQVLTQSRKADRINISALKEGVYLLQIELAGGVQISKRILILR
ncbi:MAG: T9SS type A sorting domain-containing protein [Bacteroidales bacterium]|nr:T9SS type A sorting domain-containing protein [Bacteroidales bacterium]